MKHLRILWLFGALLWVYVLQAQTININRVAFTNYLVRMYENAPFEGVRVVDNGTEGSGLISVVRIDPTKYGNNTSTMNRIASVKATSQVSRFFNGSQITDNLVIRINESDPATPNLVEVINERASGFVTDLEELTNFPDEKGLQVYIYYKSL